MLQTPSPPPQEAFFQTDFVRLRRWLPWLHLFRIWGMSLDARKIFIGAIGLWLVSHVPIQDLPEWSVTVPTEITGRPEMPQQSVHITPDMYSQSPGGISWSYLVPMMSLAHSLMRSTWSVTWALNVAHALIQFLVLLYVGVAISRMAAVEFTTGSRSSIKTNLNFANSHVIGSLFGLLIPGLMAALLWGMGTLLGPFASVAYLGMAVIGLVTILSAMVMLIVWCVVLSTPLVVGAVAVDHSDGFDSFSRSFYYLFNRGIYYLIMIIGSLLAFEFLYLWGVYFVQSIQLTMLSSVELTTQTGQSLSFWFAVLQALLEGWRMSIFWTTSTVCYFLVRLSADGTPLDQMWRKQATRPAGEVPLVGLADREANG